MDFFANQDGARRQTRRLVVLFVLAVAVIVAAVNGAFVLAYWTLDDSHPKIDPLFYLYVSCFTLAVIAYGTFREIRAVASGGAAVALDLGARPVAASTTDPAERRLLNVVEEIAIASGTTVPQVFVMDREAGINAFAAGFSPNEAAIAVTRGALETLNRAELQGVIGHEFSHILNGDMRLNLRLMGVLGGLLVISVLGMKCAVASFGPTDKEGKTSGDALWPLLILGAALMAIGYVGVFFGRLIKSGMARQREFLADASSVQFTRNPDGIGGALARIAQSAKGALVGHPHAEKASHMFFGEATTTKVPDLADQALRKVFGSATRVDVAALMASHPPVGERLEKIYGRAVAPADIVARVPAVQPTEGTPGQRAPDAAAQFVVATHAAAVAGAVGTASADHVDYAASLLDGLPSGVRESLREPRGARLAMFGLVLALGGPVKAVQAQLLGGDAEDAFRVAAALQGLGKASRLPLISLAIPVLKPLPEGERLRFLALLQQLIEADRRVTLEEFVLGTLLSSALKARVGRPPTFRSLDPLAGEARLVLSLIAHAGGRDGAAAFERGYSTLGLASGATLADAGAVKLPEVEAALGRLNQLVPLQKAQVVKACVEVALADGQLSLGEAELLRAVCAVLDCPLPPFLPPQGQA